AGLRGYRIAAQQHAQIEVVVLRLGLARGYEMYVNIEQHQSRSGRADAAGRLFQHFTRRGGYGVDLTGFEVSAGLQPALQFLMENEECSRARQIDDNGARRQMARIVMTA